MTLAPGDLEFVREFIRAESAIVIDNSKGYLVDSRLAPLASELALPDVAAIIARVRQGDRAVRARVVDAMTTNETSWFRDVHIYRALENEVLPELLDRRERERSIAVWSAACSTGQEPYTLAMVLADELADRDDGHRWNWSILGTDLSPTVLEQARRGVYDQLEMNRGLPAARMVRHFARAGAHWQVSAELRRRVSFRELNLATAFPPMPKADLILLRNVLIYFDNPTKQAVLERVLRSLKPDGYLVLGAAESLIGVPHTLQTVRVGSLSCYQHRKAAS
jgi:chemotaxis protein methyltransferase CheR